MMRITFIGSPHSGKTTTAAMLFAYLKDLGLSTEFLTEYARQYIARRRAKDPSFRLQDDDQYHIFSQQLEIIDLMQTACPDSIILCDSSPLNALLYMTPDCTATDFVRQQAAKFVQAGGLMFWSRPVDEPFGPDANRLHDEQQSLAVDAGLLQTLSSILPSGWDDGLVQLIGNTADRARQAIQHTSRMLGAACC